jgi:cytochrome b subunit of formate dehydrogenase
MCRYTFRMKLVTWLLFIAAVTAFAYGLIRWRRRRAELQRASEERFAALMAEAIAAGQKKAPSKG